MRALVRVKVIHDGPWEGFRAPSKLNRGMPSWLPCRLASHPSRLSRSWLFGGLLCSGQFRHGFALGLIVDMLIRMRQF